MTELVDVYTEVDAYFDADIDSYEEFDVAINVFVDVAAQLLRPWSLSSHRQRVLLLKLKLM